MSVAIVTGSSGLIGSEAVQFLHAQGLDVIGLDNNMRQYFFGPMGSVDWNTQRLKDKCPRFTPVSIDIRDQAAVLELFRHHGRAISVVIHAASQPSHDWAAREPFTDFSVNATGTLVMLEAVRQCCPEAVFIFTSTNKVYGDASNQLPLEEKATRWEIQADHAYFAEGIDETLTIDQSKHSLFGVSKAAADLMVQEYGRYFGLKTAAFRCGCLTGPAHSGVELHGFLAYLTHCALAQKPYTIFGYKGKQVRDNLHSADLVQAFWSFIRNPKPGAVYNMGGGRFSHCSMLEAIDLIEKISGRRVPYQLTMQARSGDHIWWVSDVRKFKSDFPEWSPQYGLEATLREIVASLSERLPSRSA
jgi:CDP-paratose 2-epimerase